MFEEYTYDYILNNLLSKISDDLDKREGSVIYNAIAPVAMEIYEFYNRLINVINEAYIDTANGQYLDNLTRQFGISRNPATFAIKKGTFYDNANNLLDVDIGKRFSINSVIYSVLEKISTGIYQMKCETSGNIGNNQSGNLLPIDYIEGLSSAQLSDLLIPAVNEETDDELRLRYYNSVDSVAFGGNIADYKEKVKEIEGVGGVKVIPTWNGGGTVKLIILDNQFNSASSTLITNIQDAVGNNGNGIAPIGHEVTTVAATNVNIIITAKITLQEGFDLNIIEPLIEDAINEYFTEVKKGWEESNGLTIRIAHIESRILDVNGVLDISNTMMNNSTGNLVLENDEIPLLSDVVLTEASEVVINE